MRKDNFGVPEKKKKDIRLNPEKMWPLLEKPMIINLLDKSLPLDIKDLGQAEPNDVLIYASMAVLCAQLINTSQEIFCDTHDVDNLPRRNDIPNA